VNYRFCQTHDITLRRCDVFPGDRDHCLSITPALSRLLKCALEKVNFKLQAASCMSEPEGVRQVGV
jgi:hypothetical protein